MSAARIVCRMLGRTDTCTAKAGVREARKNKNTRDVGGHSHLVVKSISSAVETLSADVLAAGVPSGGAHIVVEPFMSKSTNRFLQPAG